MPIVAVVLLLLTALLAPAADLKGATPAVEAAATPRVGYLPIKGGIDQGKSAYFKRALAEAKEQKLTHVVVHLTTPGGELGAGMEMLNACLDTPKDAPRLIAFVDDHSLSAGSLIAYGHDEILVTAKAMLGDIGVITMSSEGKIEYLPEKVETVVRTLLRNAAQNRGWDQAKLVKMTARTQELYRFDLGDGKQAYVIEDDLGTWLAAHPGIKGESKVVTLGKDRLLSYTAREAVDQGMATALVDDLDAAYARLHVARKDVIDLSPSASEEMSWKLASFAPLLIAAAMLFIFLEFKVPAGGLWLIGAGVAGVAFFICQFYLDLANYLEVVLILVGLALIALEFLILPLAGLFAASGGILLVIGLVLAFMPTGIQFQPSAIGWGDSLSHALIQSLLAIGVLTVGFSLMLAALPRIALATGLADAAAIDATSAGEVEVAGARLAGATGTVRTILRPSGQVFVDGASYDAVSEDGAFIEPGEAIVVTGARHGGLVVRKAT